MIIKSCYIESFGVLEKKSFVFNEGLNIIEDDNGKGKTTLSVFIKSMFYGMEYSKKRKELTEREKYLPWQGGSYGGRLIFSISGKEYEITRYFGKKKDEDFFELRDTASGKPSSDYSENIGEEIFGIDAESFERSIFISLGAKTPAMQDSINAKLGGLIDNTDDINNFESAYNRLLELSKSLKPQREGGEEKLIKSTRRRAEDIFEAIKKCEDSERKCVRLSEERAGLEKKKHELEAELEKLSDSMKRAAASGKLKTYSSIKKRIADMEKEVGSSLDFFNGKIPGEDELRDMENTEQKLSEIEGRIGELKKHYGSEENLSSSIKGIKEIFPEGFPEEEEETGYMNALQNIEKEMALLSDDNPLKPSEKELSEYEGLKKKIHSTENTASNNLTALHKKLAFYAVMAAIITTFTGFAAAILILGSSGITDSILPFILLWLVVMIFSAVMGARTGKRIRAAKEEEAEFKRRRLSDKVSYEALDKRINSYKKLERETREKLLRLKNETEAFEKKYRRARPGGRGNELTKAIDKFRRTYDEMTEDKKSFSNLKKLEDEYTDKLYRFFDLYCERNSHEYGKSPRELISDMRKEKVRYSERMKSLEKGKNELEAFLKENDTADMESLQKEYFGKDGREEAYAAGNAVEKSIEDLQKETNNLMQRLSETRHELEVCDRSLLEESEKAEAKPELENEYKSLCDRADAYEKKYELITKTMELLSEAKDRLSTSYMHDMRKAFEHYLSLLDDGDMRFMIDNDLKVEVEGGGRSRRSDYLSRGYADLVNICTRLALISVMFKDEKPFIIFDDPFVNLDEGKLKNALEFIKKLSIDRQVIYFFCHPSRKPYPVLQQTAGA